VEESRGRLPSRSKSERKAILSKEVRRVIDEVEETGTMMEEIVSRFVPIR